MSSPTPDNYVGLMAPWKPIAGFAMKNVNSVHDRIEIDHSTKDGDVATTDSIGATTGFDDDAQASGTGIVITSQGQGNIAQRDGMETSGTDSTGANVIVDDDIQVSTTFSCHGRYNVGVNNPQQDDSEIEDSAIADIDDNIDADGSIGDGAQIDGADGTDTDNDAPQPIDTKCVAVSTCVANSGDHRKVVSHIFGRNKACTRDLPNDLWIFWCRKHYQRFKYRAEDAENWHTIQLGLVRNQLQTFEDWGHVRNWTIALRKTEQDALAKENKNGVTYTNYISSCWERFLVPYLGSSKSFARVREVLNVIERKFNEAEYRNRDKKLKTFPGVEFLPAVQKTKEVKKPAAKKGEIGYKKITLDQPAFNRKTRANIQFIKDMAAKKAESSPSPKRSGTGPAKDKSPDTDSASDASATKKRKTPAADIATNDTAHHKRNPLDTTAVTPTSKALPTKRTSFTTTTETPPTFTSKALPTKRRRLTRGYEKHASEGEDTTFMEEEEEKGTE
ncbi:hypothetical protein HO133_005738 [Letharia lupina]|uniref:Uncharacterized protein n=1 Tax=Letharia lupina TaxID=560253 RepID=A0A8H6F813_9LECA|nr:uncharacterized protein HO133_005738 [Letharia lupina]KAF6218391.1 hypothetical protein HO133_005738 [Letharia lupina]